MRSSLRIIVTGLITQHPLIGGITWHYLQYLLGLAGLGHDVFYFEDSGEFPYNLDGGVSGTDWIARDCAYNVGYLARTMARFGLEDKWVYRFAPKSKWYGLSEPQRKAVIQSADLLINVSGSLEHPAQYRRIPHLLYIDTDPVITQIKIASGDVGFIECVAAHDTHFSFGESLPGNLSETSYEWRPTRQPVVLSEWQSAPTRRNSFTTVMNWTSYEPLVYGSRTYGQKDIEFQNFLGLPGLVTPVSMEVALSRTEYLKWRPIGENAPSEPGVSRNERKPRTAQELLTRAGWHVVDAIETCGDLDSYRHYIETSKAEWSVAKNAYVLGQPGWFSERSACYLAAGRPVVVQDTGFSGVLPVGEGILPFKTLPEAAAAILAVESSYTRHAKAARALAEAYFDSDVVLAQLIDVAMSAGDRRNRAAEQQLTSDAAPGPAIHVRTRDSKQKARLKRGAILKTGLWEHPAVKAWGTLHRASSCPEQVEVLKQQRNGAVYRLAKLGPGNSAIIAKRCRSERLIIERTVYERVLPVLPVRTLEYYGCVEEDDQFWWLFLEDAGRHPYFPLIAEHRTLAAEWLAAMNLAAAGLELKAYLPSREPDHYLMYLQAARQAIPKLRVIPSLKATQQTILQNIVALCEFQEAHWDQVEAFCHQMPRTFTHGNCLAKNVNVRTTETGSTFMPFDWGGGGWGLPATDLGQLGLPYRSLPPTDSDWATYASVVKDQWPALDFPAVQQLANLGQMFWALKVIARSVPDLDHKDTHIDSLMDKFGVYKAVLSNTIRAARWE